MRHSIHKLHPGQVILLWGLTVLGLWAFNSRRLDPALGVEEVEALATYGPDGPPTRDADSLAQLVNQREGSRSAMAEAIAADSLALIGLVAAMTPFRRACGSEQWTVRPSVCAPSSMHTARRRGRGRVDV